MSNSLWPHGLCSPWHSPGQNTGVGSLSLLQGIFPTQGSNPGLLRYRQILYQHIRLPSTGHKESDMTERLNWTEDYFIHLIIKILLCCWGHSLVIIHMDTNIFTSVAHSEIYFCIFSPDFLVINLSVLLQFVPSNSLTIQANQWLQSMNRYISSHLAFFSQAKWTARC